MADESHNVGLRFQNVVRASPKATAIIVEGQVYTFEAVNKLSNRIAYWLKARGLNRGQVVCLELTKIIEAYALAIACIKTGMPYAFLDPSAPPERTRQMLNRCRPALIVSLHDGEGERVLLADIRQQEHFARETANFDDDDLAETTQITGSDPAYIMFTSGSTGEPKGAVIAHAGVLNLADWASNHLGITPDDRLTNVNPLYFDNSVFDIYGALLNGAAVVALDAFNGRPPADLIRSIDENGCTFFFAVPTLFMYLDSLRLLTSDKLQSVRQFMFGGEGFPISRLRHLFETYSERARLINCYGPTETSCICSSFQIISASFDSLEGLPPLGWLNPNFSRRILDADLQPVITGQVGELWLGGLGVGLGYLNNPEETAKRFCQDPLITAYRSILYRTGDLVVEDQHTGVISFRGRVDNQIKLLGYRIELEEVDYALEAMPGVEKALTVVICDRGRSARLRAAYSGHKFTQSALLAHCQARLPSYMLPSQFTWLERIPVNANGKSDRRMVAETLVRNDGSYASPGNR